MAMTKGRRDVAPPSGSLIVWMAGLVLGAGAGVLFIYHTLLASHSIATRPLHQSAFAARPVATGAPSPAAQEIIKAQIGREHEQALQAAMKPSVKG